MSFFSQFPQIKYDINANGVKTNITDMFRHVDVKDEFIDNYTTYAYYNILEGERPDVVSNNLYGTPDHYWTFFVVNESLKQGLNTWPKSYRQFELMLEQDYEEYSTLIFIPRQYPVARKYENSFEMVNYFGGLDLSNENVRVRTYDSTTENPIEAKILRFDDQRYQLWVYDINNLGKFSNNRRWSIVYAEQELDQASTAYSRFVEQRTEWTKAALEWTRMNQTTVYYAFIKDGTTDTFVEGSDAYYKYFLDTFFSKIVFVSHRFFEKSYNAPSYFLDNEFVEEKSTAFDAYESVYNPNDIQLSNGYTVGDIETNVSSVKTDGFDQSELSEYASISRNRKYIPSFVKTYTSTEASFVSIKDELSEKALEAMKIRVIRPEHIDEFTERYKEILLK